MTEDAEPMSFSSFLTMDKRCLIKRGLIVMLTDINLTGLQVSCGVRIDAS